MKALFKKGVMFIPPELAPENLEFLNLQLWDGAEPDTSEFLARTCWKTEVCLVQGLSCHFISKWQRSVPLKQTASVESGHHSIYYPKPHPPQTVIPNSPGIFQLRVRNNIYSCNWNAITKHHRLLVLKLITKNRPCKKQAILGLPHCLNKRYE